MCFCFQLGGIFASVSNSPNDELFKNFSKHSKGDSQASGRPSPTTITWAGRGLFLTHLFSSLYVTDGDPIKDKLSVLLSHLVHSLAQKPFRGHVLMVFVLSQNWAREALGQPVGMIWSRRAKGKSVRQRSPLGRGRSQRWIWGGYGSSFCSFVDEEAALGTGQRWDGLTWDSTGEVYGRMKS